MEDLIKITQVVDKFTNHYSLSKVPADNLGLISIEIAIKLGEYQAKHGNLDFDAMLASDDRYSLVHDLMGIWTDDTFTPRFLKH